MSERKFKSVAELLSDPDRWAQGKLAYNKDGFEVHPESENAVCWCLIGATMKIYGDYGRAQSDPRRAIERAVFETTEKHSVVSAYNDDGKRTHDEIVTLVEKAGV